MKKILGLLLVFVLMVSFSSLALADEAGEDFNDDFESDGEDGTSDNDTGDPDVNESVVDDDTEGEIEIMNSTLGAEIRLLQLEKAISRNLLKGDRSVVVLQEMSYNTTSLEGILDELRLVLEEVQAANVSDNDSVQQFVDLKSDARKLTKDFRDTIKDLLSDVKYRELKEQIQEMVGDNLQNYSKKIQNRIRQFNRNQLHRLFVFFNESNESLGDEYQNGTVSIEEVKSQISELVNTMGQGKKNHIYSELKKEKINKKNYANEEAEDIASGFEQREQNRTHDRSNKGNHGNNGNDNNNGNGNGSGNGNGNGNGNQ